MNHEVRIEHRLPKMMPLGMSVDEYLLKFKYWYGEMHMHFRNIEEVEEFSDEIKEAVEQFKLNNYG